MYEITFSYIDEDLIITNPNAETLAEFKIKLTELTLDDDSCINYIFNLIRIIYTENELRLAIKIKNDILDWEKMIHQLNDLYDDNILFDLDFIKLKLPYLLENFPEQEILDAIKTINKIKGPLPYFKNSIQFLEEEDDTMLQHETPVEVGMHMYIKNNTNTIIFKKQKF